jgi:hypothetical protein
MQQEIEHFLKIKDAPVAGEMRGRRTGSFAGCHWKAQSGLPCTY